MNDVHAQTPFKFKQSDLSIRIYDHMHDQSISRFDLIQNIFILHLNAHMRTLIHMPITRGSIYIVLWQLQVNPKFCHQLQRGNRYPVIW
jgi:hypothetical protein